MDSRATPRIVYVLPEYDENTGSHFFHLYEFLKAASGKLDIFVVVERCRQSPQGLGLACYCQKFGFPPLRFLELTAVLLWQRFRGRRSFYTHYSYYGALASWFVICVLGGQAYYWNSGLPWLYARPRFEEFVFRFILRHTILVTDPPSLGEEYQRRYGLNPARIRIVPHFISVERFRGVQSGNAGNTHDRTHVRIALGIPGEARVVLFVHRLSRRKGAHLIPDIAAEVIRLRSGSAGTSADSAKRSKDVIFVVVGEGPERKNLESRIKNLELGRFVRLMGEVPHRELPAYYRAADVLLLPSEEEGFPHVLLEAMASGLPYVASDVGGVREVTPPELRRYVVPCGNISAFAVQTLALLAKSHSERAALAGAEQELVKHYDTEAILPQFAKLFKF